MKPNPRIVVPAALLLAAASAAFVAFRRGAPPAALVASGTVEGTEAQLGFQAPGRILVVSVREGDTVSAGAELARLDLAEAEARRAQARAQAAAAHQALLELERGATREEIGQARAAHDAAAKRYEDARLDSARAGELMQSDAVAPQAWDKARTAAGIARAQLRQAEEQYRQIRVGPRRERVDAGRAQVANAEAGERIAQAVLENMKIRAPFRGVVTVRHHEPGEVIPAGTPVLSVLNRDDRWVRIYVPENRIGAVRVGMPAGITTDSAPRRTIAGRVTFVASEAEFTPRNVQTREERVKLVYAVKVRIEGDPGYDLKPGMPADVRLALR